MAFAALAVGAVLYLLLRHAGSGDSLSDIVVVAEAGRGVSSVRLEVSGRNGQLPVLLTDASAHAAMRLKSGDAPFSVRATAEDRPDLLPVMIAPWVPGSTVVPPKGVSVIGVVQDEKGRAVADAIGRVMSRDTVHGSTTNAQGYFLAMPVYPGPITCVAEVDAPGVRAARVATLAADARLSRPRRIVIQGEPSMEVVIAGGTASEPLAGRALLRSNRRGHEVTCPLRADGEAVFRALSSSESYLFCLHLSGGWGHVLLTDLRPAVAARHVSLAAGGRI